MAVAVKPEVEIWRRPPKKSTFDPGFLLTPSDTFSLGRTVSPQYKTSQTDGRQTDDTRAKGATDSTVDQKSALKSTRPDLVNWSTNGHARVSLKLPHYVSAVRRGHTERVLSGKC